MTVLEPLDALPNGIRARFVDGVNGLRVHLLEAGDPAHPLVLLLHGFPELAYSWRKVMLPLAAAGFHVVAPDQRGYGRTTGWSGAFDQDLAPFTMPRLAADAKALLLALGREKAAAVIGHDFGSPVAAWCALLYPETFASVALMSAPFGGPPAAASDGGAAALDELAALTPPRLHYQRYYATRAADADMWHPPQGLHDFLRAYFHHKSADWRANKPYRLKDASAASLGELPTYYVMESGRTMPETVAPHMPSGAEIAACRWLPEAELAVYAEEYARTGFQGGLNWYRTRFEPALNAELARHAGRRIDIPAMFIAGASDWGVYQVPGAFERMQSTACSRMSGCHLIGGAGHWVMQEQPEAVSRLLIDFCRASI